MAEIKQKPDANQCIRQSYDTEVKALRMIPSEEMSFAVELDHKDGDSIYAVPMHMSCSEFDKEMDASSLRVIRLHVESGQATIMASPHPEDDVWYSLLSGDGTMEVIACRIKLVSMDPENSKAYMVGRS